MASAYCVLRKDTRPPTTTHSRHTHAIATGAHNVEAAQAAAAAQQQRCAAIGVARLLEEAELLLQLDACVWPVREHGQLRLHLLDVLADGRGQLVEVLVQLAAWQQRDATQCAVSGGCSSER